MQLCLVFETNVVTAHYGGGERRALGNTVETCTVWAVFCSN